MELLQVIKALSDETRVRILTILTNRDLCVCELEALLNINQSNASRHLNKLTNAGILEYYKVAKYVYYKLNDDAIKEYPFIKEIIEVHATKQKQCSIDYEKYKKYKDSGLSCDDLKDGKLCLND